MMSKDFKGKEWIIFIISILLLTDLAILLNIPFLRQIFGFLFLTILPGLLILQNLRLKEIESTEKFVLSVGLSVSFLMFFGLLINNLSLSLSYETPLATIPLLISFNLALVVLAVIGYKTNKDTVFSLPKLNLNTLEKAFLIVPILFPALSIFGMHMMNTTDNNILLMFLLFLIPIYVAFVCIFNHKFPKRLYPVVIFLISISLLLMLSLRSNHITIFTDTGREMYFFRTTLDNLHWSVFGHSTLDACLSISLLPTIYKSILCVNEEFLFKTLFSFIFPILPLAIYLLSKKYVGNLYAFLASFFFISQISFLDAPSGIRTNLAVLFCALAIMTLFNDNISEFNKRLLFIIFAISTVVSHYSTTYIFFFVLLLSWFGMQILPNIISCKRKKSAEKTDSILLLQKRLTIGNGDIVSRTAAVELHRLRKGITIPIIILFFVVIFLWYSQLTETAFNQGVRFMQQTIVNLNEFFVVESRGTELPSLFGEGMLHKVITKQIHFASLWMTFILIGVGIVSMIYRYGKMLSKSGTSNQKSNFLKTEFEIEYVVIAIVCGALLFISVALPFISVGYDIQRIYPLMLTVLSLCFALGGITLSLVLQFVFRWFKDLKSYQEGGRSCKGNAIKSKDSKNIKIQPFLIILIILVPYFLSTTGVSYQIGGIPSAITLNSEGLAYDTRCIHDQESYASVWLARYTEQKEKIYTNRYGFEILGSQGKIPPYRVKPALIPTYEKTKKIDGYIFLEYHTVVSGEIILFPHGHPERRNLSEYSQLFVGKGKIYNNGGSEVYI